MRNQRQLAHPQVALLAWWLMRDSVRRTGREPAKSHARKI